MKRSRFPTSLIVTLPVLVLLGFGLAATGSPALLCLYVGAFVTLVGLLWLTGGSQ